MTFLKLKQEQEPLGYINGIGFTYKDYLQWDDSIRVELIDGLAYMLDSPSQDHNRAVRILNRQLEEYFQNKPCEVFLAPMDVRLFPQDDDLDKDVVQPDLFVVCDKEKLGKGHAIKGAPDFVIEIMSYSSRGKDLLTKKDQYEKAGVREYWVVDFIKHYKVYKYVLRDGEFEETLVDLRQVSEIAVEIFENLKLVVKLNY